MTDRIYAYTVTLNEEMREDDAEWVTNAIKMIKHVGSVVPLVSTPELHYAEMRAQLDLGTKIMDAIYGREEE